MFLRNAGIQPNDYNNPEDCHIHQHRHENHKPYKPSLEAVKLKQKECSKCSQTFSGKMAVFRNIAPCSLIDIDDVSEVFTVSIVRAMRQ
jgi:ribosomal protein S27AE